MDVESTPLQGLKVVIPRRFGDARGFFSETWSARRFEAVAPGVRFVQDNHSVSARAGTLRGLHFQSPPHAQGKLVRCGRGRLWDVAVDARKGSPTYGEWFGTELSAANGHQLWVPEGFLHGFLSLEADTEIVYKCTAFYEPAADGAVRWDSCGIAWPLDEVGGDPVLSDKDAAAPPFEAWRSPFDQA